MTASRHLSTPPTQISTSRFQGRDLSLLKLQGPLLTLVRLDDCLAPLARAQLQPQALGRLEPRRALALVLGVIHSVVGLALAAQALGVCGGC